MRFRRRAATRVLTVLCSVVGWTLGAGGGAAHAHHGVRVTLRSADELDPTAWAPPTPSPGVSGQGKWRFRVLYPSSHLPKEALSSLASAHGGFAVDRRPGRGETYFVLPGAGIIQVSADLRRTRLVETPEVMKKTNLHNTTIWFDDRNTPYLVFPANDAGKVFTTTLDGKLVNTLSAPSGGDDLGDTAPIEYFRKGGRFAPTDVAYLYGLYYVTTGYSDLDYVLTARILGTRPFRALWNDLAFGGRGSAPGLFGTGHGITVAPDGRRLDVADRPNSRVSRFTRYGRYQSSLSLPTGSFPCDIDYEGNYAVVGCLYGPDRSKGAPIYVLDGEKVVSTLMPKEDLGLERFEHIHNAVFRRLGERYYIIAQAWNPGDFAILEQLPVAG